MRNHVRVLGASRWRLVVDLYAPAVVGSVTASMRSAVSFALVTAIVAELISANSGIGFVLSAASQSGQPARLVAGVLVTGVIGFALDRLLLLLERRFSVWRVAAAGGER